MLRVTRPCYQKKMSMFPNFLLLSMVALERRISKDCGRQKLVTMNSQPIPPFESISLEKETHFSVTYSMYK